VAKIEMHTIIEGYSEAATVSSGKELYCSFNRCQYLSIVALVRYKVQTEKLIVAVIQGRPNVTWTLGIIVPLINLKAHPVVKRCKQGHIC
jgi:hypothetical protein